MVSFHSRAESVLKLLDQFLAQFAALVSQQRVLDSQQRLQCSNGTLLHQMLHAQAVVEQRRRHLLASFADVSVDHFVHELWALAGDMPHFEFDIGHLAGAEMLMKLREDISLKALILTKDLTNPDNKAAFVAELKLKGGVL